MNNLKQKFDASTVAVMRQALNEVVTDRRFLVRKSVTTLEVAEHILQQAAFGERDLNRLKSAASEKLSAAA
jgi:anti-sigma regulatory factor (Ser/Thr protein kinase)